MKLSVVVPTLNESKTILKVLKVLDSHELIHEILVIDDGSTDNTPKILKAFKSKKKFTVLTHLSNLGKGAAVRWAFKKITGDFVIIQDADLEYNPKEYKKLIEKAGKNHVVYGSRIISSNPKAYLRTYLGNVLLTQFCNLLYGTQLTDSYTCYKLIPTKIVKSLDLSSNGFEIEAEITAQLAKKKIQLLEVPISYKPRSYEKGKKIKAKDAIKGILTYVKLRFDSLQF